jgi:seryl-tRNA synthetase
MHDIRFIRDNPDTFDRALRRRNLNDQELREFSSENVLSIDGRRRAIIRVNEGAQAERRAASEAIRIAKSNKDEEAASSLLARVAELKQTITTTDAEQKIVQEELDGLLAKIPNLPLDDVPDGKDEKSNVERHKYWPKREIKFEGFSPEQHFDLGEALGQMDFETAAKLSGARFVVLKGGLARLERALGQFMLDVHTSEPHNYLEIAPPLLVRDEVMFGTGQLPKFREDQFMPTELNWRTKRLDEVLSNLNEEVKKRNVSAKEAVDQLIKEADSVEQFWLIPTAEVPLTNLVRESIVDEAELPMRFTACTPCFRAEAGAAGRDTRGMIRQHQFTKVELVSITTQEQSKDEHERMLACAEEVLKKLDLHYRVVTLCAGDMGFASQKTYDIEVWLPGQGMFREISSCSTCGEFQARRMNARYKTKEGKNVPVHTLNGSGVAVGRAMVAVMETYQQEDGSIAVPDALAPYMGGIKKIEKAV